MQAPSEGYEDRLSDPTDGNPQDSGPIAEHDSPSDALRRSLDELRRRYQELQRIQTLSLRLGKATDADAIGSAALEMVERLLDCRRALLLLAADDGAMRPIAGRGLSSALQRIAAEQRLWPPDVTTAEPRVVGPTALLAADDRLLAAAAREEVRSLVFWPLVDQQRLLGTLVLGYRQSEKSATMDRELAQTVAEQVARAIARQQNEQDATRLRRQLEERVEQRLALLKQQIARRKEIEEALRQESARVKLLQRVAIIANEARSTDEMLGRALTDIATHLGWPLGHVYALAPKNNDTLISTDIWYCSDEEHFADFMARTRSTSFALGEGWLGQAAEAGVPAASHDLGQEVAFIRRDQQARLGIKAGFALPVLAEGAIAVVLEFFSAEAIDLGPEHLDLMAHVAAQLGRAIERERAQERLIREEMLLAQAERIAHLGSWNWDLTTATVSWSDEMCRIYGVDPADFAATFDAFLDRIHPDDRQRIADIFQTSIEQQRAFQFHHRIIRPDGTERILHGHGRPEVDDAGNVVRFYGTGQDLTEQIRLQEKLVRQTETLQALEQMGHAVTSTFDRQVIFQEVLAKVHELLGAQGVFMLLLQADQLVFSASSISGKDNPTGRRISANSGVAGEVLASGEGKALFGDEARERTFEDFVRALGYRPGALLVAPLRLRGNLIGVLEAMHQRPDGFTDEDLPILEATASWTAIAVQNAGLVRQLSASRERLRRLAREVVTAQEQERRRISRELHDEAGQALTALKIQLGMLEASLAPEQPDIARQLAEAVQTTDQTMEQIRRLAHGLHPPVLDKFGLGAAAEALCADFARRTSLDVQAHIEALPHLDEQSAISLYRVLQEALTNIAKHAEASAVTVTLTQEDETMILEVGDDGRGFEAAEQTASPQSGLGLVGMQERVELLGGHMHVEAAPGQGARILARVPYQRQRKAS